MKLGTLVALAAVMVVVGCDDPAPSRPSNRDMTPPVEDDMGGDAVVGRQDGGMLPDGATPLDSMVEVDSRVEVDEGMLLPDEGMVEPDEGMVEPDEGMVEPDEGMVEPDEGVEADEGVVEPDEGLEPDMAPPCLRDCDDDGLTVDEGDCDDNDPTRYLNAPELCDGMDQDCDDAIDEGLVRQCFDGEDDQQLVGVCRPGTSRCVAGAYGACEGQVAPSAEVCGGGADEDCDGAVDEGCDEDDDGVTVDGGDCDDGDPARFPGNPEVCDGVDNDCDRVVDGVREACYDGADGTEGVGACRAGERVCAAGAFGACEGQVVPRAELCGDGADDDCDGEVDEGCDVDVCPPVDLGGPVVATTSCLTAGSGAQAIVYADVVDGDGAALPGVDVAIAVPGAVLGPLMNEGSRYYRVVTAPAGAGTLRAEVSVGCDDGNRVALAARPSIDVVAAPVADVALLAGGCAPMAGNLRVRVLDAESGTPIEGAWVLAGQQAANVLLSDPAAAMQGARGAQSTVARTAANGEVGLVDFGDTLYGPNTVSVGATGYAHVTMVGFDGSMLIVPLRQIEPPPAPVASVSGRLTDFEDLGRDGEADLGLVVRSFDLSFVSTLRLPKLLSRYDCWDPVTQGGFIGDFVRPTQVPGNLYVPQQPESVLGQPVTVDEHLFTLSRYPVGPAGDRLLALAGKVPVDGIVNALTNGADLSALVQLLVPEEIGVLPGFAIDGDTVDVTLPLAGALQPNAGCDVSGLPDDTGVFCFAVGDWSGANGTGRLFPMGLASADPEQVDPTRAGVTSLDVTTVARAGVFGNIGYLGVALGSYLDPARAPAGQGEATTAVFDRESLGPGGGRMAFDGFFGTTALARVDYDFSWAPVERPGSAPVDVCRVDIYRELRTAYDPGDCTDAVRYETVEYPNWDVYVAGDPGMVSFPRFPREWPLGATAGFFNVGATPEDDRLYMRVTCYGLGLLDGFDFSVADFRALVDAVTHVSSNYRLF